jgi:predicted enzyme related to lactoylglutathione lyase
MKRVTGLGGVFFKSQDPEGNKIELWEPVDDKL